MIKRQTLIGLGLSIALSTAWAQRDQPEYHDPRNFDMPPAWSQGDWITYSLACRNLDSAIDLVLALQKNRTPILTIDCRLMPRPIKAKLIERRSWGYTIKGIRVSIWAVLDQANDIEHKVIPDDFGPRRKGV